MLGARTELSARRLGDGTGLSIANAWQHLQHMRRAGLVTNRREGKFVYYRLADDAVLDLLAALRRIAERDVAEVERLVRSYFNARRLDDGLPKWRAAGLPVVVGNA